jgi:hypothetical protein
MEKHHWGSQGWKSAVEPEDNNSTMPSYVLQTLVMKLFSIIVFHVWKWNVWNTLKFTFFLL